MSTLCFPNLAELKTYPESFHHLKYYIMHFSLFCGLSHPHSPSCQTSTIPYISNIYVIAVLLAVHNATCNHRVSIPTMLPTTVEEMTPMEIDEVSQKLQTQQQTRTTITISSVQKSIFVCYMWKV